MVLVFREVLPHFLELASRDDLREEREDRLHVVDGFRPSVVVPETRPLGDAGDELVEAELLVRLRLEQEPIDLHRQRTREIGRFTFLYALPERRQDGTSCPNRRPHSGKLESMLYLADEFVVVRSDTVAHR